MPATTFRTLVTLLVLVSCGAGANHLPVHIVADGAYDDLNEIHHSHGGSIGFGVAKGVLGGLGTEHDEQYGFDYRREYSPKLSQIYSKYLHQSMPIDDRYGETECVSSPTPEWNGAEKLLLDGHDFGEAFSFAGRRVEQYERANQEYLASDPRGLNFSAYIY